MAIKENPIITRWKVICVRNNAEYFVFNNIAFFIYNISGVFHCGVQKHEDSMNNLWDYIDRNFQRTDDFAIEIKANSRRNAIRILRAASKNI